MKPKYIYTTRHRDVDGVTTVRHRTAKGVDKYVTNMSGDTIDNWASFQHDFPAGQALRIVRAGGVLWFVDTWGRKYTIEAEETQ